LNRIEEKKSISHRTTSDELTGTSKHETSNERFGFIECPQEI